METGCNQTLNNFYLHFARYYENGLKYRIIRIFNNKKKNRKTYKSAGGTQTL